MEALEPEKTTIVHESPRLSVFSAEVEQLCTRPSIAGYNGKAIAPRLERFIHDIARAASAYAQASEAHDRPAYRVRACDRRGLLRRTAQHVYRFHQHVRACEAVFRTPTMLRTTPTSTPAR